MIRRALLLAGLLVGCGDDHHAAEPVADAAASDASGVGAHDPTPCVATFSENFNDRWDGPASCATLSTVLDGDDTVLSLSVPSSYLGVPFDIAIDLGASPGAGTYTSALSAGRDWHVTALEEFDMTSCLYQAGAGRVPPGTYALTLDALDDKGAHGTLDMTMYVLSRPYTYCGERTTEQLHVRF